MYLLWWGHKVDGCVVIIVFLDEAEGELVVDQKVVCLQRQKERKWVKKERGQIILII